MTPQEIARRLLARDITPVRVRKFYALCARMKVLPEMVLALLTDEQREQVKLNG